MSDKPYSAKWLETYYKHVRRAMTCVEVDVPYGLRAGTGLRHVYHSAALPKAYEYFVHLPPSAGAWLAHGRSSLGFGYHAWVELSGGVVYDGMMQRFYGRADYRFLQQSTASYLYSKDAAHLIEQTLCQHNKSWLPLDWYRQLQLPEADPGHPLVVNGRLAFEYLSKGPYREFVLPFEGYSWSQDDSRPDEATGRP